MAFPSLPGGAKLYRQLYPGNLGPETDRELLRRHRAVGDLEHRLRRRNQVARRQGQHPHHAGTDHPLVREGHEAHGRAPDNPKVVLNIDQGEYFAAIEDDVDKTQSDINLMQNWSRDAPRRR